MNLMCEKNCRQATLRPAGAADEAFLLRLYSSTREDEMARTGWSEQQMQTFLKQQFQAQDLHYRNNYPGADLQVIEVDGEAAGRLYVHERSDEIRIMDIALLPKWRGRGIGTELMEGLLSEGTQSSRKVSIHVEMFNPALRWYERMGFRKVSADGPYFLMEWTATP